MEQVTECYVILLLVVNKIFKENASSIPSSLEKHGQCSMSNYFGMHSSTVLFEDFINTAPSPQIIGPATYRLLEKEGKKD